MTRAVLSFAFGLVVIAGQSLLPAQQTAAKPDPMSPANIGRTELVDALDKIAEEDTKARRVTIAAITTRAGAEARQAEVRRRLLKRLGGLPKRTPLNAKTLGSTQADGFRIEKVLFESQPGFPVTALLYLPDQQAQGKRLPAILVAPGHGPQGKASDFFTSATLARNGFIVLSYDPIGQGERLQYPDPSKPDTSLAQRPTGEHGEAGLQPTLIGDAIARYFAWDAVRAIDYLVARPEVDPARIGAFGCSGGGAMTALTAAVDPRVAATAVACYNTSFDTLLSSIGPQDAEQSTPGFIADGLDFADLIELVAPRPYAAVATYSDMFPFSGARATVTEARRFYGLFNPSATGQPGPSTAVPATPTGPASNADTSNAVAPDAPLQFITGPGGHGALGPIMDRIVGFFLRNLQPGADADHPYLPKPIPRGAPTGLPAGALQVTNTGQVATSFPHVQTVFSLNLQRAHEMLPKHRSAGSLQQDVRVRIGSVAQPGTPSSVDKLHAGSGALELASAPGVTLRGDLCVPPGAGRHPAQLLLVPHSINADDADSQAAKAKFTRACAAGNLVLALTPSPSPPGTDDMKAPMLGPFYLLSLRAELLDRTLVGLRVDDVVHAVDYLASRPDVDVGHVTATGSGHMGLVLLHAALLDQRLKHVDIDHVLSSYSSLLAAPLPIGASEDIVPGVLLHYDLPDLTKALGARVTETNSLPGTADLSQTSTPIDTLRKP